MKTFSASESFYSYFKNAEVMGLEVLGVSREELLENASLALMNTIVELKNVVGKREVEWSVDAVTPEELLMTQLQKIIDYFDHEKMIFSSFQVSLRGLDSIKCLALGEPFDPQHHTLNTKVKAVTAHKLFVGEENQKWVTRFMLDS